MKLIVGLGNPGKKYEKNRHNLGYMVVSELGSGMLWRKSLDLMCYFAKDGEFILIKPTTFMNLSGESVKAVCRYFKITPKNILVVCDDIDLDFGKIRLAFDGSSAGHNGMDSVIKSLATPDFNRIRIGIGRPPKGRKPENFVLSDFTKIESAKLKKVILGAVEAINSYLSDGIDATMNRFN